MNQNSQPPQHLYADLRYNIDEDRRIPVIQDQGRQAQRIQVDVNRGKLKILEDKNKNFRKKRKQKETQQNISKKEIKGENPIKSRGKQRRARIGYCCFNASRPTRRRGGGRHL